MPETGNQVTIVIVAAILILLFFGIMFLVIISYYNNKKLLVEKEKIILKENFERQMMQSQLEVQEQIFNHVSQEIHDNVGQVLSFAKVQIHVMEQQGDTSVSSLKDVKDSIATAMSDLREIAHSLNSQRIQQYSLEELVRRELTRAARTGVLQTGFIMTGDARELSVNEKLVLFRIVQEGLQNIIKHANATSIDIGLSYQSNLLLLEIRDDGVGFALNHGNGQSIGIGLQNMKQRMSLINGSMELQTVVGKGTFIQLKMPYEKLV